MKFRSKLAGVATLLSGVECPSGESEQWKLLMEAIQASTGNTDVRFIGFPGNQTGPIDVPVPGHQEMQYRSSAIPGGSTIQAVRLNTQFLVWGGKAFRVWLGFCSPQKTWFFTFREEVS